MRAPAATTPITAHTTSTAQRQRTSARAKRSIRFSGSSGTPAPRRTARAANVRRVQDSAPAALATWRVPCPYSIEPCDVPSSPSSLWSLAVLILVDRIGQLEACPRMPLDEAIQGPSATQSGTAASRSADDDVIRRDGAAGRAAEAGGRPAGPAGHPGAAVPGGRRDLPRLPDRPAPIRWCGAGPTDGANRYGCTSWKAGPRAICRGWRDLPAMRSTAGSRPVWASGSRWSPIRPMPTS